MNVGGGGGGGGLFKGEGRKKQIRPMDKCKTHDRTYPLFHSITHAPQKQALQAHSQLT